MKKEKIGILQTVVMFALLLAAASLFAQEPRGPHPTPEQRAQHITEKMVNGLKLNEQQARAVKEINLRYAQKIDQVRQDPNAQRTQKTDRIEELFRQKDNELQSILTKEQFERFKVKQDEKMNQMRNKMKQRAQNAPPPEERAHNQAQRMQKHLNLSPEQQQKAEQIALKYAKQAEELRNQEKTAQQERKRKFAQLKDQREQEMRALLTDEQNKKFDQLKQQRQNHPPGPNKKEQQPHGNGQNRKW